MQSLDDTQMLSSVSGFAFSGLPVDVLAQQSNEFTVAKIVVDESGSVSSYVADLEKAIKAAVGACQKNPLSEQMLFSLSAFANGTREVHGFIGVGGIDLSRYDGCVKPHGLTALHDGFLEAIETVTAYGDKLVANRFTVNGTVFVITDGGENASKIANPAKIKAALDKVKQDEKMESIHTVLIGVGSGSDAEYQHLVSSCGIDQYIAVGDATPAKLARMAEFISKSISSSSQALGTGGPSQNISF